MCLLSLAPSSADTILLLCAATFLIPFVAALTSGGAPRSFKAAVWQGPSLPASHPSLFGFRRGPVAQNLDRAETAIRGASQSDVEIIVFPELFLQGFDCSRDEHRCFALDRDGPELRRIGDLARECGVAVCITYGERARSGSGCAADDRGFYNSAALFDCDGRRVLDYRKTNLAGGWERSTFDAGSACDDLEPQPASVLLRSGAEVRCAVGVCYDVESPELCRYHALRGAEVLLVPTALGDLEGAERVAERILPTRAMENQMWVLYANYEGETVPVVGAANVDAFVGRSVIIAPDGEELVRARPGAAVGGGLLTAMVELDSGRYLERRSMSPYLEEARERWVLTPVQYTPSSPKRKNPLETTTKPQVGSKGFGGAKAAALKKKGNKKKR